jgi:hypothetical protein
MMQHDEQFRLLRRAVFGMPLPLGMMFFAIIAFAGQPFWENKDWTRWSELQCDQLLALDGVSPRAQGAGAEVTVRGVIEEDTTRMQFKSALPIRLALARRSQFKSKYQKMDLQTRQEFDKRIQLQLNENFDDRVVLHIEFSAHQVGRRAATVSHSLARPATLILPNGTRITSSQPESVNDQQGSIEFDVNFPRLLNGRPLLDPGDKKFKIDCGGEVEFDASKMYFHGKFEY